MKKTFSLCLVSRRLLTEKAFTLIELMVGLGVFGLLMVGALGILGTGAELSSYHSRSAAVTEQMADGLTQLSSILPQVVRINACQCSGTSGDVSGCTWTEGSWSDPVLDAGVSNGSVTISGDAGHPTITNTPIFDADFEAYYGGDPSGAGPTDANDTAEIPNIGSFACGAHPYPSGLTSKGCRQRVRLFYQAPTIESGSTPSLPGQLQIVISASGSNTPYVVHNIGSARAGSKTGLVGLSCGLVTSGTQTGMNFAINLKMKIKQSNVENPLDTARYESWHPTSTLNYARGFFRDTKLKFSFANLAVRGAYQWRMTGIKKCTPNGVAASSKDVCCSGAWDGTNCTSCVPSGEAGTANTCCSETVDGANCK